VSASTIILLTALRRQRRLGYILIPLVFGIYISTVWGRFHYALDVIAGLALAGTIFVLFSRFGRSPERSA
jgi:membrane-associated phospholipid phosphatase